MYASEFFTNSKWELKFTLFARSCQIYAIVIFTTFILLWTWRKMDARGKKTCYTVNDGTKIVLYILTISTFFGTEKNIHHCRCFQNIWEKCRWKPLPPSLHSVQDLMRSCQIFSKERHRNGISLIHTFICDFFKRIYE